jgi:hypothetical protein
MAIEESKRTLKDRIRSLLAKEFEELPPDAVAGILSNMASELAQMSEAGIATVSEALEISEAPIDIRFRDGAIQVTILGDAEISDTLNQILNVGALLLPVNPQPALNATISLRLTIPSQHLECVCPGRVVHVSATGVAIELSQMSREDRASFESLWPRFQSVSKSPEPSVGQTMQSPRPVMSSSDSVVLPHNMPRSTPLRRRFDLTDPDVKVLTSTQFGIKALSNTREFYGPESNWLMANGEPERVEVLAEDRVADIFLQLSEHGTTGLIEINTLSGSGPLKRQVLIDSGFVVEVSRQPRSADEELGLMLLRADRITRQQLAMSAAHAEENENSLERSLLDLQILDPDRIRHAIAGRLTFLLSEILNSRSGELRIYESNNLPAGFLPSPPLRVHVAVERVLFQRLFEQLKTTPLKDRETLIQPLLDAYPEIAADDTERVDRALEEKEHIAVVENLLNGRRRLREVFTESNLPHADTFALVQALHRMGLLRFDRSLHQTVVRERFRENVTVKYLSVHKASYFEVLNVHWSAYDDAVNRAYEDLCIQFDPAQVPASLEPEVHKRVAEIRERVESAYQVLGNRETRHSYRKRIMPDYKLAHAIPLFLKQAELAEKRRQWNESADALKRVLEIEPINREARIKMDRIQAILENRLSPDAADSNF